MNPIHSRNLERNACAIPLHTIAYPALGFLPHEGERFGAFITQRLRPGKSDAFPVPTRTCSFRGGAGAVAVDGRRRAKGARDSRQICRDKGESVIPGEAVLVHI